MLFPKEKWRPSNMEYDELHDKTLFGFWVYLMTDCVLFATLFATYAVLHKNIDGGPAAPTLFSLPFALTETLLLLTSSFICGVGYLAAMKQNKNGMLGCFALTFIFGAVFLAMEIFEFWQLVHEGASWQVSAFLSAFFTLVGTHGLHIVAGLLWLLILAPQLIQGHCLSYTSIRRVACFSLFWHFLDVIWIFIFTFVYLMGVAV